MPRRRRGVRRRCPRCGGPRPRAGASAVGADRPQPGSPAWVRRPRRHRQGHASPPRHPSRRGRGPLPGLGREHGTVDLAALNRAPRDAAVLALLACCASAEWAAAMADRRPFADIEALLTAASDEWWIRAEDDWLEAFAAHPRLGEQRAGTHRHSPRSRAEQAGGAGGDAATRGALVGCNRDYEARFGYEFLIYATGVSAADK